MAATVPQFSFLAGFVFFLRKFSRLSSDFIWWSDVSVYRLPFTAYCWLMSIQEKCSWYSTASFQWEMNHTLWLGTVDMLYVMSSMSKALPQERQFVGCRQPLILLYFSEWANMHVGQWLWAQNLINPAFWSGGAAKPCNTGGGSTWRKPGHIPGVSEWWAGFGLGCRDLSWSAGELPVLGS